MILLRTQGLLKDRHRLHGKQSFNQLNALLEVFAVAALVQLTEKWFSLPEVAPNAPHMVCNTSAFDTRCMAKLVHEEYLASAKPLVEHLCSQCGCLLAPALGKRVSERDQGKKGQPFQTRGKGPCAWDAMPPFLLLFSKRTLANKMPVVFDKEHFDRTKQLRLRSNLSHLPWLNYTRGEQPRKNYDTERAWHAARVNTKASAKKKANKDEEEPHTAPAYAKALAKAKPKAAVKTAAGEGATAKA